MYCIVHPETAVQFVCKERYNVVPIYLLTNKLHCSFWELCKQTQFLTAVQFVCKQRYGSNIVLTNKFYCSFWEECKQSQRYPDKIPVSAVKLIKTMMVPVLYIFLKRSYIRATRVNLENWGFPPSFIRVKQTSQNKLSCQK